MLSLRRRRAEEIVREFSNATILVVGDVMLDQFLWGSVARISPEAPVPVVKIEKESFKLGGAGNVVNNIRSLGGNAVLCGLVGDDAFGKRTLSELKRRGIETEGIFRDTGRVTTVKTRIIAHSQHVVRADREEDEKIPKAQERKILQFCRKALKRVSALIVSDYAKGVVSKRVVEEIVKEGPKAGIEVFVDPKVHNFPAYSGAFLVTPNHHEVRRILQTEVKTTKDLETAGKKLLRKLGSHAVLVTRGEEGMSLFEKDGGITHIPTVAKEVYDVSGAGDTVISTLVLSHASGASLREAAMLSNHAAGIVVGKVGTATVTSVELLSSIPE